jgi:predicted transcriptional regulator
LRVATSRARRLHSDHRRERERSTIDAPNNRPTISRDQAQTQFVDDMIQRVFGGAADQLILRAINSRHVSRREREEIRKLLRDLGGESK